MQATAHLRCRCPSRDPSTVRSYLLPSTNTHSAERNAVGHRVQASAYQPCLHRSAALASAWPKDLKSTAALGAIWHKPRPKLNSSCQSSTQQLREPSCPLAESRNRLSCTSPLQTAPSSALCLAVPPAAVLPAARSCSCARAAGARPFCVWGVLSCMVRI